MHPLRARPNCGDLTFIRLFAASCPNIFRGGGHERED